MWYPQCVPFEQQRVSRRAWLIAALGLAVTSACKKPEPAAADGTLLTPYLAIGETLADDELDNVATHGAQIVAAAEPQAEQPGVAEVLAAAGRIGAADIATVRLAYRKLSEGMIAWLAAHPEQREGLMLVHCPMAFTNEGAYWVQSRGQLRNPYEGAMMLRCGADIAWDDYRRGEPPAGDAKVQGMP
jgi:protein tyrosine phosphatase (PTP) superfamily phosphohydrolase (DUF442 family)